jgi:hypothetical protein
MASDSRASVATGIRRAFAWLLAKSGSASQRAVGKQRRRQGNVRRRGDGDRAPSPRLPEGMPRKRAFEDVTDWAAAFGTIEDVRSVYGGRGRAISLLLLVQPRVFAPRPFQIPFDLDDISGSR